MTKTILSKDREERIRLGEKILVAQGDVRLGGEPGSLDKMLGAKERRRVIGEQVVVQDENYEEYCINAFDNFIKKISTSQTPETLHTISRGLEKIEQRYGEILQELKKNDQVNWSQVSTNLMMLSSNFMALPSLDIASYATKSISDALTWLQEKSGGIKYGAVMFAASRLTTDQATSAKLVMAATVAIDAASSVGVQAVMVGDIDYPTTVYCGPQINCDNLRGAAESGEIMLLEKDQGFTKTKEIEEDIKNIERVILAAHGYVNLNNDSDGRQRFEEEALVRADKFAAHVFPNAKIIHSLGCRIGTNPRKNYDPNDLKPGQILFLHAGALDVPLTMMRRTAEFLTINPNPEAPFSVPLQILAKNQDGSTTFAELTPVPFEQTAAAINDESISSEEERVSILFNLITTHINTQKNSALENFVDNRQIASELEKLGFRDFSTQKDKAEFVRDYLGQELLADNKQAMDASLAELVEKMLRLKLMDADYDIGKEYNAVLVAANVGNNDLLEVLIRNRANTRMLTCGGG